MINDAKLNSVNGDMMMTVCQAKDGRLRSNAGIAIGPILFIIAILAILAAAIAAGSGSFTGGTATESDKTKSSALIQIGENLKIGMDRITMEGGLVPTVVDTAVGNTALSNALFSPIGGGIAPPSVGMANNPRYDHWYFPKGLVQGFGTGGSNNDVLAVLPVSAGVCQEINNRVLGTATLPTTAALGDFTANTVAGNTTWPTTPNLVGVASGCVLNSSVTGGTGCPGACTAGPTSNYFYYEVLAIQ